MSGHRGKESGGRFALDRVRVGGEPAIDVGLRRGAEGLWFGLFAQGFDRLVFSGRVTSDWPGALRALADRIEAELNRPPGE